MAIEVLHLRKLLLLLYAGQRQQQTLLRAEIRSEIAKERNLPTNGGDFYGPFWADAKDHVTGVQDLHTSTKERISKNKGRERLYPLLRDGFLRWWDEQRRWTNSPFESARSPNATLKVSDILSVKIDGILTVRDALGVDRYIYPYFYEHPTLRNEGARVSLWLFSRAFPGLPFENFRILDVIRGRIFSPDRCYLEGDEQSLLENKFHELWTQYVKLEEEYR